MHFDHTLIESYFPDLTDDQKEKFKELGSLYSYWNERINLISRKDFDYLYLHHVLHSLGVAKVIQFNKGTKVLDFGTGGGFPGIPLAILFPEVQFHLVDSIQKKIKVVNAVQSSLELKNVTFEAVRVEELKGSYDFAIGRAVTRVETVKGWVRDKISAKSKNALKNGLIYFRGSNDPEVGISGVKNFALKDYFSEDFFESKLIIHLPIFFSLSQKKAN